MYSLCITLMALALFHAEDHLIYPTDCTTYQASYITCSSDTVKPVEVITNEKMNIMIDTEKELIALQWKGINREERAVLLTDSIGKIMAQEQLYPGSTIVFFETQTLYEGNYLIKIRDQDDWITNKIKIYKPQ